MQWKSDRGDGTIFYIVAPLVFILRKYQKSRLYDTIIQAINFSMKIIIEVIKLPFPGSAPSVNITEMKAYLIWHIL